MARLDCATDYLRTLLACALLGNNLLAMSAAATDTAQLEPARTQLRLKQFQTAADLLLPIANGGNGEAEWLLAGLYHNGLVADVTATQNAQLARQWLEKSAAHGNADAMYQLAAVAAQVAAAQHDAPDHDAIQQWLLRAAKAEHPLAKDALKNRVIPLQFQPDKTFTDITTRRAAFWLAATHDDVAQLQAFNDPSLIPATDEFGRTALSLAARAGASHATAWLLQAGANPNHADSAGLTPLMLAASRGNSTIVTRLLAAKANHNAQDRNGNNALMYAISSRADTTQSGQRQSEVIALLLDASDLQQRNQQGWSALDWAINSNDLNLAARLRNLGLNTNKKAPLQSGKPIVPLQHAATADIYRGWPDILIAGTRGGTELFDAVLQNNAAALKGNEASLLLTAVQHGNRALLDTLLTRGAISDSNQSETPLSWAVRHGDVATVQALLAKGVKPDMHGKQEVTPLLDAMHQSASIEIVNALLKAGANTDARNAQGRSPLMLAVMARRADLVERLLQSAANPNASDRGGLTALMMAAMHQANDCVRALTNAHANLDQRDTEGNSALLLAAAKGNADGVELLLGAGATPDTNRQGDTALIMAATTGNDALVKRLLGAGFKVNAINKHGDTALIAAVRAGQTTIVRTLLAAGADAALRNNDRASAKDVADRLAMKDISALLGEHG